MKIVLEIIFALLLVYSIYLFSSTVSYTSEMSNIRKEIVILREEIRRNTSESQRYLESRINRVAQTQDDYQSMIDSRVRILENKDKKPDRSININNSNNVYNTQNSN